MQAGSHVEDDLGLSQVARRGPWTETAARTALPPRGGIYEAFTQGKLEAPRVKMRTLHPAQNRAWPISALHEIRQSSADWQSHAGPMSLGSEERAEDLFWPRRQSYPVSLTTSVGKSARVALHCRSTLLRYCPSKSRNPSVTLPLHLFGQAHSPECCLGIAAEC